MNTVRSLEQYTHSGPAVVTMGTFDGVHPAHRAIIDETTGHAARSGHASVLVTFDPHPREVLGRAPEGGFLLSTIDERLRLIEPLGIDVCLVLPFTRDLSLLEPEEFFQDVLCRRIGAAHVVVGFDHAFGKGRHGHIEELRRMAADRGVLVTVVPEVDIDGRRVSSTAVRNALLAGDAAAAARLLGRPYEFSGIVQRGEGRGRLLGFPTANLTPPDRRKLLPADGVYAVEVVVDGARSAGMMNIGIRPTVSDSRTRSIEVHVFDRDGDLYGARMSVHVIARIRDEQRFTSVDALAAQLERDRAAARSILEASIIHQS